jgi:hypothetical protein
MVLSAFMFTLTATTGCNDGGDKPKINPASQKPRSDGSELKVIPLAPRKDPGKELLAPTSDHGAKKLRGTWAGWNQGQPVTLTFRLRNRIIVLTVGAESGEGRYSVDLTSNPAHLDIDWGKRKIRTIIELGDDTLKLEHVQPGTVHRFDPILGRGVPPKV